MTGHQRPRRTPRRNRPQRFRWMVSARELHRGAVAGGFTDVPYLIVHPDREMAFETNGLAYCTACREGYTPRLLESILSPAMLRAQRWAHSHNAERHPRRWLREQHFQAPIPEVVRQRAACTCVEDVVCGPCMTGPEPAPRPVIGQAVIE